MKQLIYAAMIFSLAVSPTFTSITAHAESQAARERKTEEFEEKVAEAKKDRLEKIAERKRLKVALAKCRANLSGQGIVGDISYDKPLAFRSAGAAPTNDDWKTPTEQDKERNQPAPAPQPVAREPAQPSCEELAVELEEAEAELAKIETDLGFYNSQLDRLAAIEDCDNCNGNGDKLIGRVAPNSGKSAWEGFADVLKAATPLGIAGMGTWLGNKAMKQSSADYQFYGSSMMAQGLPFQPNTTNYGSMINGALMPAAFSSMFMNGYGNGAGNMIGGGIIGGVGGVGGVPFMGAPYGTPVGGISYGLSIPYASAAPYAPYAAAGGVAYGISAYAPYAASAPYAPYASAPYGPYATAYAPYSTAYAPYANGGGVPYAPYSPVGGGSVNYGGFSATGTAYAPYANGGAPYAPYASTPYAPYASAQPYAPYASTPYAPYASSQPYAPYVSAVGSAYGQPYAPSSNFGAPYTGGGYPAAGGAYPGAYPGAFPGSGGYPYASPLNGQNPSCYGGLCSYSPYMSGLNSGYNASGLGSFYQNQQQQAEAQMRNAQQGQILGQDSAVAAQALQEAQARYQQSVGSMTGSYYTGGSVGYSGAGYYPGNTGSYYPYNNNNTAVPALTGSRL